MDWKIALEIALILSAAGIAWGKFSKGMSDICLRIKKLENMLFPGGRPSFRYRDDCDECKADIIKAMKDEVGHLRASHDRIAMKQDEMYKYISRIQARIGDI